MTSWPPESNEFGIVVSEAKFGPGQPVRVRAGYPIGHCRTPYYFRGATGVVERHCGQFGNPEELAYGREGELVHLYRVRTRQQELWPDYPGPAGDTIDVEVYEHWLEPLEGLTP